VPRSPECLNRRIFELRDRNFTTREIAKTLKCGTHTIAKCLAIARPAQKKVLDVLNKKNWIKGHSSKTKQGYVVSPNNPEAAQFCLLGAIVAVYGWKKLKTPISKVAGILRKRGYENPSLANYNDASKTTWKDIEQLIKEAGV
jgi:prolyl-tRNA editing enzyme YbaK/EbsC (Cys-tRNA(Pro) deacylase)